MAQAVQHNWSIEAVMGEISTASTSQNLTDSLRTFSHNREPTREAILANFLPNGQDPLEMLDMTRDTVGFFFLLCVVSSFL